MGIKIKEALDNIIPTLFFSQKSWDIHTTESIGIVNDCMLILNYPLVIFQKNTNISNILYFSKSTSINTQHGSLDTLATMLFTKDHIKWKCIARIQLKSLLLIYLKIFYKIRY